MVLNEKEQYQVETGGLANIMLLYPTQYISAVMKTIMLL